MKSVRGILIDPKLGEIKEVSLLCRTDGSCLADLYMLIGCTTITNPVILPNDDGLIVDDEGLFVEEKHFFKFADYTQPLCGRGILLGTDKEGESADVKTTLSEVRSMVKFLTKDEVSKGFDECEANFAIAKKHADERGVVMINGLYRPEGY